MADNYQALIPQWREKFLTLDILDKARQLELTVSGDSIYISYYNRDYVVSVSTGEIKNRRDPNAYIPHCLLYTSQDNLPNTAGPTWDLYSSFITWCQT